MYNKQNKQKTKNMRPIIACVVLGSVIGAFFHQYDPQNAEFILYKLIPLVRL
jgi:hypothetical protein